MKKTWKENYIGKIYQCLVTRLDEHEGLGHFDQQNLQNLVMRSKRVKYIVNILTLPIFLKLS